MQPWFIYTCGYPFSGKSTLARAIAEATTFALVEVDAHMTSADRWLDAYVAAYAAVRAHLDADRSVVLDSVAHTRKNRARLHRIAAEFNSTPICVWLDVSVDEADRRRQTNRINPSRPHVPDDGFTWITSEFEPPTDQDHLTYRPESNSRQWISQNLLPIVSEKVPAS